MGFNFKYIKFMKMYILKLDMKHLPDNVLAVAEPDLRGQMTMFEAGVW